MRGLAPLLLGLLLAAPAVGHDGHPPAAGGSDVEDLLARGDHLKRTGRVEAARAQYERALAQAPRLVDALRALGRLEEQAGRPVRALALHDRLLKERPGDLAAQSARGRLLLVLGRHDEAAAQLLLVLEASETWQIAVVHDRVRALELGGRKQEAAAQALEGIRRLGRVPILVAAADRLRRQP